MTKEKHRAHGGIKKLRDKGKELKVETRVLLTLGLVSIGIFGLSMFNFIRTEEQITDMKRNNPLASYITDHNANSTQLTTVEPNQSGDGYFDSVKAYKRKAQELRRRKDKDIIRMLFTAVLSFVLLDFSADDSPWIKKLVGK